jgi:hypothetical protein
MLICPQLIYEKRRSESFSGTSDDGQGRNCEQMAVLQKREEAATESSTAIMPSDIYPPYPRVFSNEEPNTPKKSSRVHLLCTTFLQVNYGKRATQISLPRWGKGMGFFF